DEPIHDIYVMGFQEIEMTAQSLVKKETILRDVWERVLKGVFKFSEMYSQLCCFQMVGLLLCIYIKNEHLQHLTNLTHQFMKEGFHGNLGNKGCISVRFDLYNRSFCFINLHLEAHSNKLQE